MPQTSTRRFFLGTTVAAVASVALPKWVFGDTIDDFLENVPEKYKEGVKATLQQAADNAPELMSVLPKLEETMQESYFFLLAHMSTYGHDVPQERKRHPDSQNMTAELLLDNIVLAHQTKKDFAWAASLDDQTFMDFVLPYRVAEEKLENWRRFFWELKDDDGTRIYDKVKKMKTSEEAAGWINNWLAKKVRFNSAEYQQPEDEGPIALLRKKQVEGKCEARCEEMAGIYNAILRTFGIAGAEDMTEWWPDKNGNHAWNAVYIPEQKEWKFVLGAEPAKDKPYWDHTATSKKYAKVYRGAWSNKHTDVTADYTDVVDLDISGIKKGEQVTVAVFNAGRWRPLGGFRGPNEEGIATIKNLGAKDILYHAIKKSNGQLSLYQRPFMLTTKGPKNL